MELKHFVEQGYSGVLETPKIVEKFRVCTYGKFFWIKALYNFQLLKRVQDPVKVTGGIDSVK